LNIRHLERQNQAKIVILEDKFFSGIPSPPATINQQQKGPVGYSPQALKWTGGLFWNIHWCINCRLTILPTSRQAAELNTLTPILQEPGIPPEHTLPARLNYSYGKE